MRLKGFSKFMNCIQNVKYVKRTNDELNVMFENEHNFITSKGNDVIKDDNSKYFNYLDDIVVYENKKLEAVKKYPPLNELVKEIRKKNNISEDTFICNIIKVCKIDLESDSISQLIRKLAKAANKSFMLDKVIYDKTVRLLKIDFAFYMTRIIQQYFKNKMKISRELMIDIKKEFILREHDDYYEFFNLKLKDKIISQKVRQSLENCRNENEKEELEANFKALVGAKATEFKMKLKTCFVEYAVYNRRLILNEEELEDRYLNFTEYYNGWSNFTLLKDEFVLKLNEFFERHRKSLYNNRGAYIVILYFILFNKEIDSDTLKEIGLIGKKFKNQNIDYKVQADIAKNNYLYLKTIEEFTEFVDDVRRKFNIVCDGSIKSTVNTYNKYFNYIYKYNFFNEKDICFYQDIHNVFECCGEFLNYKNPFDYLLILNYILYDQDISTGIIFNGLKTGVLNFYSFQEIINNKEIKSGSLFVEMPVFITDEYIECMAPLIISKVIDHYKLSRKVWRQFPHMYYRNKFIFELVQKYNRKDDLKEISDDSILKIINELDKVYPNGYKDEKFTHDLSEREINNNYTKEIKQKDMIEDIKDFIKESLKQFKRKNEIFQKEGGLR